jgi:hypothetical protein
MGEAIADQVHRMLDTLMQNNDMPIHRVTSPTICIREAQAG